ncbi:MAG: aldo/keto reductase [Kofleriaceae bacterium]
MIALGLAALGRPGYITSDHASALGDRSPAAMEAHCHAVLDAAYAHGIRWFDAARSYGRAEEFLSRWIASRGVQVTVSSKWGYRYTADWQVEATHHEIKDHSLAALDRQIAESRALLALDLYEIHSVTPDSPVLDDAAVIDRLASLRDGGLPIGLSLSGPHQRAVLERALEISVGGTPLFSTVQATWNLYERSVEPALIAAKARGLRVMIKEALANGRLMSDARLGPHPDRTALGVALGKSFVDVVLSGAASVAQLESNVLAVPLADDFAELAIAPDRYWSERSRLPWN